MNVQYKFMTSYLPRKHYSGKFPMFYAYNGRELIMIYSFDKIKRIIYASNLHQNKYFYLSLYEYVHKEYEIITNLKRLNELMEEMYF